MGSIATVTEQQQFDLVVIGGGPGGYAAALYGASAGLSVALVEKDKVGGTCLHRGCIPAKELLETAAVVRIAKSAGDFGIELELKSFNWARVAERKQQVIDTLFKGVSGLLKGRKVTVFAGTGSLGADHVVEVVGNDGEQATLKGTHVVLASGSSPRNIPGFEPDGARILNSDSFFDMSAVPRSAVGPLAGLAVRVWPAAQMPASPSGSSQNGGSRSSSTGGSTASATSVS